MTLLLPFWVKNVREWNTRSNGVHTVRMLRFELGILFWSYNVHDFLPLAA